MSDHDRTDPTPQGRWSSSGPDPDAPPWAGRRGNAEDRDDDTTDDAADDQPTDEATAEDDDTAAGVSTALDTTGELTPPRPPRRTGIFLDPDDLRVHVGDLLRAMLGGYQVDAFGNFTFTHEGARVFVTIGPSPIGPQIGVFSITNVDVDLSPDLARFLLATNHRLGFGSFSYDGDNRAIWLRHTLLGTTLDMPELHSAVAAVASTAAHFDDRIRDRFGGRAFHDAPQDVQDQAKPPEPDGSAYPNAGGYL
jgi:hypothetical protein